MTERQAGAAALAVALLVAGALVAVIVLVAPG